MPVVCVSGGLDSYLAWVLLNEANGAPAYLANKPQAIFVDYGQPYLALEQAAVAKLYPNVTTVTISNLPPLGRGIHIPARNLMLATLGCRFSDVICLAGVKDELCSDKNPAAFQSMSRMLTRYCGYKVTVFSPLWQYTKQEAVAAYLAKGYPAEPLLDTVSCYSPTQCNNCDACFRRAIALANNDIITSQLSPDIIAKQIRGLVKWPQPRVCNIIKGLQKMGVKLQVLYQGEQPGPTADYYIIMSDCSWDDRKYILRKYTFPIAKVVTVIPYIPQPTKFGIETNYE